MKEHDPGVLNENEVHELAKLGKAIRLDLECDINGTGVPCLTDRLEAVANMKKYLRIHGQTKRSDFLWKRIAELAGQIRNAPPAEAAEIATEMAELARELGVR